jgi:outer membrane protein OmpA-like peptidoglycan-associated protein
MKVQMKRVSYGLLAALFAAALLKFAFFDVQSPVADGTSLVYLFWTSLASVLFYALPWAALAVVATERLRLRHLAVDLAIGIFVALAAAHISAWGEALNSPAYAGGALNGLLLLVTGILPAIAYWLIAGQRAGWRGDDAERADTLAAEAFRTASVNSQTEFCRQCLIGWTAAVLILFMLLSWITIDASGLRDGLIDNAEARGTAVLDEAGYEWASFRIDGNRGVLKGTAPDEAQKRAAFDSVRDALHAVTGFPGVVAQIDNEAGARVPLAAMSQQLADAARREREAQVAIEAAHIAGEAARAAEQEAKRQADEQSRVAEDDVKRSLEQEAVAGAETAPQDPAAQITEPVHVAAVETAAHDPAGDASGGGTPAPKPAARPAPGVCTEQDLAIVESSRIHFERQRFDVPATYAGELDRLAVSAQSCVPRAVFVSGHADASDDSLFNRALGLQRAEAVRESLIARGVPATAVVAGSGAAASSDDGQIGDQRAHNRRTEFSFIEMAAVSRDATQAPDERATNCESDLADIMSQSIIHFRTASSRVSDESLGLISKLAGAIQTCGSVVVTVEGHTDKVGNDTANQGLSEERATTVREALLAAGADPTRLASRGFASSRPYDPGETAEAFALNRRIEFKVSGKFTSASTGGP